MAASDGNMSEADYNASIASHKRFLLISNSVTVTVFGLVFVLGLIGNATLIYTILANKHMRTKSNVLIVSLAAGDFLLILVCVPSITIYYVTDSWWFGDVTCKVRSLPGSVIFVLIYFLVLVLVFVNEFVISRFSPFSFSFSLTKITLLPGYSYKLVKMLSHRVSARMLTRLAQIAAAAHRDL